MSARDLKIIKEIEEIFLKCEGINTRIDQQNSRVVHIEKQIELKKENLNQHQDEYKNIIKKINLYENDLSQKEKSLNQAESHSLEVTSTKQVEALKHEILTLTSETDLLQTNIIEAMEISEDFQEKIKVCLEFLKNSNESSNIIKIEADKEAQKENILLEDLSIQKKELHNILSPSGRELVLATQKKFKNKNYFCILSSNNCNKCGSSIDSETKQLIEKQDSIISCPSCSRLFIFIN